MNGSEIRYGRKRNGIVKELNGFVNGWLETITDPEVAEMIKNDVIITGGSICSMLLGEKVNDYDVYFRTKSTTMAVANYYVNKFKELNGEVKTNGTLPVELEVKSEIIKNIKGEDEDRVCVYIKSAGVASEEQSEYKYFEGFAGSEAEAFAESLATELKDDGKGKYRPIFLSQNAITLSHSAQIVIRFYGEPEKIHDNYDFIHAMCYFDYKADHLELSAEAMEAMLSRTLVYRGSLYPIASIFRAKKFIERGWRITAGQLLKIMWQISEIDMTDHKILREQLTGVDQAYMHQLITALKDVDPSKINSAYIATIIDRIFE